MVQRGNGAMAELRGSNTTSSWSPSSSSWNRSSSSWNRSSFSWNRSSSSADQDRLGSLEDMDLPADGSPGLRVLISVVYALVCAAGLLGNLLVFFLMKTRRGRRKRSSISLFILNLAVTDFQFVLTLPFWAADTALDFSWPFGHAMCKIVLSVTVMNMYASVFFLTAMSVTRYWAVASALKDRTRAQRLCPVRWVIFGLWVSASAASLPTAVFSTVRSVAGERLCLLGFPDGQSWLALYHLQKILVAFVLPMLVVSVCYLLLLRFVRLRSMSGEQVTRRSRVTRSVTIVVLSFFLCWMPNHAITFWGVLVKFNVVNWDRTYYMVHTYVHPVTVCLAHTNSCLNPVLYCLMRREFRQKIKDLFWRISSRGGTASCPLRPCSGTVRAQPDDTQVVIPLNTVETDNCGLSVLTDPGDTDQDPGDTDTLQDQTSE